MKWRHIFSVLLPVAGILILIFLVSLRFLGQLSEERPGSDSPASSETEDSLPALSEGFADASDSVSSPDSNGSLSLEHCFIWVGDSRTAGMEEAMAEAEDGCLYIAAPGEGYNWFISSGLPALTDTMEVHPDAPVILNLGVNDYDNLELYMDLYQELLDEYPDTSFFFLSVNPIDPGRCDNITNEEIGDFNAHLRQLDENAYIDSYTYIMVNEISTIDGIHYSPEAYRLIHDYAAEIIAGLPEGTGPSHN